MHPTGKPFSSAIKNPRGLKLGEESFLSLSKFLNTVFTKEKEDLLITTSKISQYHRRHYCHSSF